MKIFIADIQEQFGVPVFSGRLEGDPLTVGASVEFFDGTAVTGPAVVCAVLVGGKALDHARPGDLLQCTLRGEGVATAKIGDLIRDVS